MKQLLRPLALSFLLAPLSFGPAGCSGGGGSAGSSSDGLVSMTITDAASDEIESLRVNVTSLRLERANGSIVGALGSPIRVDLAALVDDSELLSLARLPHGAYKGAEITIDFTTAQCFLKGQSLPAELLDASGNPLTGPVTFPIDIDGHFVVSSSHHRLLELDFDLDQSAIVDEATNEVSLQPVIVLRVDPTSSKMVTVGAELLSVDTTNTTFVAEIQTITSAPIQSVTFEVKNTTVFQIDGHPSTGTAGLQALAASGLGTWIRAFGSIHPAASRMRADYVEAGRGTYHGGQDMIEGVVVDRSGAVAGDATLTVVGRTIDSSHSTWTFGQTLSVSTSFSNTNVVRHGSAADFDLDDVTIGSRVRVYGTATTPLLGGVDFDASTADSVVRIQPSRIAGYAASGPGGGFLTLDLAYVDGRAAGSFVWSAGGPTPVDPDHFVMGVGNLASGLDIGSGTPVIARGYFSALDTADVDFRADLVVNHDLLGSLLFVRDRPSIGMTTSLSIDGSDLEIALGGSPSAGEAALIDHGFVGSSPLPSSPSPRIRSSPPGRGFFVLHDTSTGEIAVYTRFHDFLDVLDTHMVAGARLASVGAFGDYSADSNTMDSRLVSVVLR